MQRRVSELILRVEPRLWASVDEEFDEPKVLKPRGCVQGRYTISGILFLERRLVRIGSERVAEFSFLEVICTYDVRERNNCVPISKYDAVPVLANFRHLS